MRKSLRLFWSSNLNSWVIEVPVSLKPDQLHRICQWAVPNQVDRYRSLPHGEVKDDLGRKIELLKKGKLQQVLIDNGAGVDVFKATEKATTTHYSFGD